MPALNFKKRFADLVKSGKKTQTIRSYRKVPFKRGDRLYLYTGMRTKQCQKLSEAVCVDVADIAIHSGFITVDRQELNRFMRDEMASADGFKNYTEMSEWFFKTHGLPFYGQLIKWEVTA